MKGISNIHVTITSVYEGEIMGSVGIGWEDSEYRYHFWHDPKVELDAKNVFAVDFCIYKNLIDRAKQAKMRNSHARQLDPRAHANQATVLYVIGYVNEHRLIEKARLDYIAAEKAKHDAARQKRISALRKVAKQFDIDDVFSDDGLIELSNAIHSAEMDTRNG